MHMLEEDKIDETPAETPVIDPEGTPPSGEPEEKSPFQEELERIEKIEREKVELEERLTKELQEKEEEKERVMAIKDRAIENEKNKTRGVKDAWKNEVKEELRRELRTEKTKELIESLSSDPAERKVILHHFEHSIKQTGDMIQDVTMARAIANMRKLERLREMENLDDVKEQRSIASMGGASSGGSSFDRRPSVAARTAASLASMAAAGDKDRAKKLVDRVQKRYS